MNKLPSGKDWDEHFVLPSPSPPSPRGWLPLQGKLAKSVLDEQVAHPLPETAGRWHWASDLETQDSKRG